MQYSLLLSTLHSLPHPIMVPPRDNTTNRFGAENNMRITVPNDDPQRQSDHALNHSRSSSGGSRDGQKGGNSNAGRSNGIGYNYNSSNNSTHRRMNGPEGNANGYDNTTQRQRNHDNINNGRGNNRNGGNIRNPNNNNNDNRRHSGTGNGGGQRLQVQDRVGQRNPNYTIGFIPPPPLFYAPTPEQDLGPTQNFAQAGPPIIRLLGGHTFQVRNVGLPEKDVVVLPVTNNFDDEFLFDDIDPAPNKRRRLDLNGKISVSVDSAELTSPELPPVEDDLLSSSSSSGTANSSRSGRIANDLPVDNARLEERKKRFSLTVTRNGERRMANDEDSGGADPNLKDDEGSGSAGPSVRFVPGLASSANSPSARRVIAVVDGQNPVSEEEKSHVELPNLQAELPKPLEEHPKPSSPLVKVEPKVDPVTVARQEKVMIKIEDEPKIKVEIKEEYEKVFSGASSVVSDDREELLGRSESVPESVRMEVEVERKVEALPMEVDRVQPEGNALGGLQLPEYKRQNSSNLASCDDSTPISLPLREPPESKTGTPAESPMVLERGDEDKGNAIEADALEQEDLDVTKDAANVEEPVQSPDQSIDGGWYNPFRGYEAYFSCYTLDPRKLFELIRDTPKWTLETIFFLKHIQKSHPSLFRNYRHDAADSDLLTYLHLACAADYDESLVSPIARAHLTWYPDIGKFSVPPEFEYNESNDFGPLVKSLVETFHDDDLCSLEEPTKSDLTPIALALRANNHFIVSHLLSFGVKIDALKGDQTTAMKLIGRCKLGVVDWLVDYTNQAVEDRPWMLAKQPGVDDEDLEVLLKSVYRIALGFEMDVRKYPSLLKQRPSLGVRGQSLVRFNLLHVAVVAQKTEAVRFLADKVEDQPLVIQQVQNGEVELSTMDFALRTNRDGVAGALAAMGTFRFSMIELRSWVARRVVDAWKVLKKSDFLAVMRDMSKEGWFNGDDLARADKEILPSETFKRNVETIRKKIADVVMNLDLKDLMGVSFQEDDFGVVDALPQSLSSAKLAEVLVMLGAYSERNLSALLTDDGLLGQVMSWRFHPFNESILHLLIRRYGGFAVTESSSTEATASALDLSDFAIQVSERFPNLLSLTNNRGENVFHIIARLSTPWSPHWDKLLKVLVYDRNGKSRIPGALQARDNLGHVPLSAAIVAGVLAERDSDSPKSGIPCATVLSEAMGNVGGSEKEVYAGVIDSAVGTKLNSLKALISSDVGVWRATGSCARSLLGEIFERMGEFGYDIRKSFDGVGTVVDMIAMVEAGRASSERMMDDEMEDEEATGWDDVVQQLKNLGIAETGAWKNAGAEKQKDGPTPMYVDKVEQTGSVTASTSTATVDDHQKPDPENSTKPSGSRNPYMDRTILERVLRSANKKKIILDVSNDFKSHFEKRPPIDSATGNDWLHLVALQGDITKFMKIYHAACSSPNLMRTLEMWNSHALRLNKYAQYPFMSLLQSKNAHALDVEYAELALDLLVTTVSASSLFGPFSGADVKTKEATYLNKKDSSAKTSLMISLAMDAMLFAKVRIDNLDDLKGWVSKAVSVTNPAGNEIRAFAREKIPEIGVLDNLHPLVISPLTRALLMRGAVVPLDMLHDLCGAWKPVADSNTSVWPRNSYTLTPTQFVGLFARVVAYGGVELNQVDEAGKTPFDRLKSNMSTTNMADYTIAMMGLNAMGAHGSQVAVGKPQNTGSSGLGRGDSWRPGDSSRGSVSTLSRYDSYQRGGRSSQSSSPRSLTPDRHSRR
ncbi:hypothetical protein BJ742DRAFT_546084 [Cladochytrium replicatum]|nr:hypothetical protein BJ742DRAFT_546084 [Cladochytrium replicatum]